MGDANAAWSPWASSSRCGRPDELVAHFRIARANGLTDDELAEVIYHATGYAGFPAANTANRAAEKAFA